MKKIIIRSIQIIAGLYILAALSLFFAQRSLVFVPNESVPNKDLAQMPGLEISHLETQDGLILLSWYKPADEAFPTVIYFQGNAGNLETQTKLVRPIYESGFGLLMVEYRGYGGNEGEPTEDGFYLDARAGLNFLHEKGLKNRDIIIYGRSLGTGVATQLATEVEAKGLILQAPYTAIYDIGQEQYPWLPVKILARDKFDTLAKINLVDEPLFIFWGDADKTVPPHMPGRVFDAANEPKEKLIISGGGHSDIFDKGGNDGVMDFLEGLRENN